jgi:hypothetical protein
MSIVVTLPKLRRMMWTGTLMLKANAQLLSMLMPKNMAAMNAHLRMGTFGGLTVLEVLVENCVGYEANAVNKNWKKVMSSPDCRQHGIPEQACGHDIPLDGSLLREWSVHGWRRTFVLVYVLDDGLKRKDIRAASAKYQHNSAEWAQCC